MKWITKMKHSVGWTPDMEAICTKVVEWLEHLC